MKFFTFRGRELEDGIVVVAANQPKILPGDRPGDVRDFQRIYVGRQPLRLPIKHFKKPVQRVLEGGILSNGKSGLEVVGQGYAHGDQIGSALVLFMNVTQLTGSQLVAAPCRYRGNPHHSAGRYCMSCGEEYVDGVHPQKGDVTVWRYNHPDIPHYRPLLATPTEDNGLEVLAILSNGAEVRVPFDPSSTQYDERDYYLSMRNYSLTLSNKPYEVSVESPP